MVRRKQDREIFRVLEKEKQAKLLQSEDLVSSTSKMRTINSSGAIAAALAGLLQILEVEEDKREILIEKINNWENKSTEELKRDATFKAVFRKAWILDDCSHNFSSSGTGPFSSLVGSPNGDLLLYFTQKKGFDSMHSINRLSKGDAELRPDDFEQVQKKIGKIDWWGKKLPLKQKMKESLGIVLVYCGSPKDTGNILADLEKRYGVPVENFRTLFSDLFPEKTLRRTTNVARPISDFLKDYPEPPLNTEFYAKSIFSESLGLLSWILVRILHRGNLKELVHHIITVNKFLDFYGVFTKELDKLSEAIKKINQTVGIKITGAGGGGDLVVLGDRDSIEGIENNIKKEYPVHFSTNRMGWEADGLTILRPSRKKIAIAVPEQDIMQNTMEIGFKKNKPYILINQKPPKKHLEEWLFAPLVLLAAARNKGKKVNKIAELLLPEFTKKEQLLTEIRHFLMTATFKTAVDRRDILPSDGHGNVELQVFEKDSIAVDHSICKFESQHMVSAEKAVDETLQLLKAVRKQDLNSRDGVETDPIRSRLAKLEQKALKASLVRLEYEAKLTFKHTRMVMKAVEIMRWKLQNEKWRERWNNLVIKCRALFEYVGYSEKRMEEDFYFPQRGRQ